MLREPRPGLLLLRPRPWLLVPRPRPAVLVPAAPRPPRLLVLRPPPWPRPCVLVLALRPPRAWLLRPRPRPRPRPLRPRPGDEVVTGLDTLVCVEKQRTNVSSAAIWGGKSAEEQRPETGKFLQPCLSSRSPLALSHDACARVATSCSVSALTFDTVTALMPKISPSLSLSLSLSAVTAGVAIFCATGWPVTGGALSLLDALRRAGLVGVVGLNPVFKLSDRSRG